MKKSRYIHTALSALTLLGSNLWITAYAAETAAAADAAAEDPGMLPVILGAVFAFLVGNLLIARSRKKQQKKEED